MHVRPHLIAVSVAVLAAGCSAEADTDTGEPEPKPHGHVAGAEETAEPQWRLILGDASDGSIHLLDPATEATEHVATVETLGHITTDGRHVYATDDTTATVIDSGVWTVDHGDHLHYYRAPAAEVGQVETTVSHPVVTGDPSITVLAADGTVAVLDRSALDTGETHPPQVTPHPTALAYAQRLVAVTDDGTVQILDRDGRARTALEHHCLDAHSPAVTRRGAVFACADGALVIKETESGLVSTVVPYPDEVDVGAVGDFGHRPGTPVLAAATRQQTLVLDIADARWTILDTGPVTAVAAAGEDLPVLVLNPDGLLRSYDPETGEQLAANQIMDAHSAQAGARIQVDTARAYINDPGGESVYELDYNDDLRLARTFELGFRPDHMVETGW